MTYQDPTNCIAANSLTQDNVPPGSNLENILKYLKPRKFRGCYGYLYRVTNEHKVFISIGLAIKETGMKYTADAVLMLGDTSATLAKFWVSPVPSIEMALTTALENVTQHLRQQAVACNQAAAIMCANLGIPNMPEDT